LFGLVLATLTAIGVASWLYRPRPPRGLPNDPEVAEAVARLGGALDVEVGDLRFATSFGESEDSGRPPDSTRVARWMAAARTLDVARARHRFDPRFDCLLGHLELAAARLRRAERRYHAALSLAPRYGEARLGLGVTLARRAAAEGRTAQRALRLQAIAQLAAVEAEDPFYRVALFDRVLLLADVGRTDEARQLADRYAALEPGSVWTGVLRRRLDAGRPDSG